MGAKEISVGQEVEDLVIKRLYEEYPWMKTKSTHFIAQRCGEILRTEVIARTAEMEAAKNCIGFLSLPAEIRNCIYRCVLGIIDNDGGRPRVNAITIDWGVEDLAYSAGQPALTRTCSQIRRETLPIFYGVNVFCIYSDYEQVEDEHSDSENESVESEILDRYQISHTAAMNWLNAIGPGNAKLLKHIEVRTGYWDMWEDWCPATRFIAHAARCGIDLGQCCVQGFTLGQEYGKDYWRQVNEEHVVYNGDFDFVSPHDPKPVYVKNS